MQHFLFVTDETEPKTQKTPDSAESRIDETYTSEKNQTKYVKLTNIYPLPTSILAV